MLNLENEDIETILSSLSVSCKLAKDVLIRLFAMKEPDQIPENKVLPNHMRDTLFNDVARLVVHEQNGSVSIIQRKFQIGFNRVAAIMKQLEQAGIVGPFRGTSPREVLINDEHKLEDILS